MIWPIIIVCILLVAIFYMKMKQRAESESSGPDAGLAILDFGRAFPDEAIRAIHSTIDQNAYFVRLHDGKAGFMLSHGKHYICHLIEAGKVNVSQAPSGRGVTVRFTDVPNLDGTYEFATSEIAAEVSLWLLGSFQPRLGSPAGSSP
ncbi:hypothetical protein [Pararhizobium gei]|uniref:hypothetical protein n=1 Tax=Pararhizobium gei TaxID=1395951 RepID=UPI0023DC12E7|nr:hypothetical protein [Rhizobium gei]